MVIDSISANGSPSITTRSLNVPGLGLVGVADQVVRAGRLAGDGLPLDAGRERGAAAAHQLRVLDLADHAVGAELDARAQRLVAAGGAVVVEADRVDAADARAAAAASRRSAAAP